MLDGRGVYTEILRGVLRQAQPFDFAQGGEPVEPQRRTVYPETLHFVQGDSRRVQNDKRRTQDDMKVTVSNGMCPFLQHFLI